MSRIQITVPVQLLKADDGFWLQVEAKSKRAASIHLNETGGPLTSGILVEWAGGLFNDALLKRRRVTGVKDKHSVPILEGDILLGYYNDSYPVATAAVSYRDELGAFVLSGVVGGTPWQHENLRDAPNWEVVGNVFQNADLLAATQPAKDAAA